MIGCFPFGDLSPISPLISHFEAAVMLDNGSRFKGAFDERIMSDLMRSHSHKVHSIPFPEGQEPSTCEQFFGDEYRVGSLPQLHLHLEALKWCCTQCILVRQSFASLLLTMTTTNHSWATNFENDEQGEPTWPQVFHQYERHGKTITDR